MTDPDDRRVEEEEVGTEIEDVATLGAVLGDTYRGELDRETTWRSRLDQTTTWSVTVMAAILTWAFSSPDNPHYIILIGVLAVGTFLYIEARRYRDYDVYRSRVRLMQGNLIANTLDPETGVEHEDWRTELSEDYRRPTLKVGFREALSNRLRRIYLPLLTVLVLAWVFRITAFVPAEEWIETAAIGVIPGEVTVTAFAAFYLGAIAVAYWPRDREAMGEFREGETGEWKTDD